MATDPWVVCDLDRSTIDRERAAVFVTEFLVWWHEAGEIWYRGTDDGLEAFAHDAVRAVGGWRAARRVLRKR